MRSDRKPVVVNVGGEVFAYLGRGIQPMRLGIFVPAEKCVTVRESQHVDPLTADLHGPANAQVSP